MDFRQVRYFVAVAELESYSRASEHLRVAQSALSRHIMDLESRVGAPMFERLARGVRLTTVGKAFYKEAKLALEHVERAFESSRKAVDGTIGRLAIGTNDIGSRNSDVARAIRAFRHAFPEVELDFVSMNSQDQVHALQEGRIDAAILIERPDGLGFEHLAITEDPFEIAMPSSHHLAAEPVLTAMALAREPFVAVRTTAFWLPQTRLLSRCRELGLMPRIVQETASEQMQVNLIRAGLGVGFVNSSIRDMLPADVVLRSVAGLEVSLRLDLAWLREADSAALAHLVRTFRSIRNGRGS